MSNKSFTTRRPAEISTLTIEPEGRPAGVFKLAASIPGDVLLDFISGVETEDPATLAKAVRELLKAGIAPEQYDDFIAFIREPENNVALDNLSAYAGYIAEVLSGNEQQPVPFGAG
jgi:glycerate-2-kinase